MPMPSSQMKDGLGDAAPFEESPEASLQHGSKASTSTPFLTPCTDEHDRSDNKHLVVVAASLR